MANKLQSAFSQLDLSKKDKENLIPGILGFMIRGQKTIEVPSRPGYVYVRLRDNLNEVVQAFNDQVSPVYNLAVLLYKDEVDKTHYRIQSRDVGRYATANMGTSSPYLPRHGSQHSFVGGGLGGGDITWVYGNQFMPLLGMPSGTNGSMNVVVGEYPHFYNGYWQAAGNTGTASMLAYKPTGSNARMLLVYMDSYGNPNFRAGDTYFAATITGTSAILPYLPALQAREFPVCGVRLVSGTNKILWNNIYDVRDHYGGWLEESTITGNERFILVSGSASLPAGRTLTAGLNISFIDNGPGSTFVINSGGDAAIPIYDDGVFKVTGTVIDFGANISVAVTGSVVFVSSTASGGGGGGTPLIIYDNGVFKTTGTSIDFGDNLDVAVTGSSVFISATASAGGGSGLAIYEDSTFKITGSAISFGDSLIVGVTGSIAYVSSSFSVKAKSLLGSFITGSVSLPFPLTSEEWDDGDMHSTSTGTSQLTCRKAGRYHTTAYAQFVEGASRPGTRYLKIHKNGDLDGYASSSKIVGVSIFTNQSVELCCSMDVELAVGDRLEMVPYHNVTGTINVAPAYFSMFLI